MNKGFAHSLIKGMMATAGVLAVQFGGRYPSTLLVFEALRRLENSFTYEAEVEKVLEEWKRRGYRLEWFRRLLNSRKAEELRSEFEQLRKDVAVAEDLRRSFYSLPFAERAERERVIFERPAEARRMAAAREPVRIPVRAAARRAAAAEAQGFWHPRLYEEVRNAQTG